MNWKQGCPRLTLPMMYDVVRACAELVAGEDLSPFVSPIFEQRQEVSHILQNRASSLPRNPWSWRKIQGALGQLVRTPDFRCRGLLLPNYDRMTRPGRITIIDLSGTDHNRSTIWTISQILVGLRKQQEKKLPGCKQGSATAQGGDRH